MIKYRMAEDVFLDRKYEISKGNAYKSKKNRYFQDGIMSYETTSATKERNLSIQKVEKNDLQYSNQIIKV